MRAVFKVGWNHVCDTRSFLIQVDTLNDTLSGRLGLGGPPLPLPPNFRGLFLISIIPKPDPALKETGIEVALTLPFLHPPPPRPVFLFRPAAYFGHHRLHRRTSSHVEPSLY